MTEAEKFVRRTIARTVETIFEVLKENASGITALAESGLGEIELTISYSKDFEKLAELELDDDAAIKKFVAESASETFTFNLSDFVSLNDDHPGTSKAVTQAVIDTLNEIGPAFFIASEATLEKREIAA